VNAVNQFVVRYCGTVKSFNPSKSFGFIECAETYRYWNRDVFLHSSHMPQGVQVGTQVIFEVTCSNAQPQARNVRPGYQGNVKSYSPEKGFGFIDCEDTRREFGQDVYVSEQEFQKSECNVLDEVLFQISLNKKGQPQAQNIQVKRLGHLSQMDIEEHAASELSEVETPQSTHQSIATPPLISRSIATPPLISNGVEFDNQVESPQSPHQSIATPPFISNGVEFVNPPQFLMMWAPVLAQ